MRCMTREWERVNNNVYLVMKRKHEHEHDTMVGWLINNLEDWTIYRYILVYI